MQSAHRVLIVDARNSGHLLRRDLNFADDGARPTSDCEPAYLIDNDWVIDHLEEEDERDAGAPDGGGVY
jgi:hypothetical protein